MVLKANASGLDTQWSTQFFNDQMQANRREQQYIFNLWKCNNVNLSSAPHVDLYGSIRPRLDDINSKLIQLAGQTTVLRASEWCRPLTESQLLPIDHEFGFDLNEATIYKDYALRHVCL